VVPRPADSSTSKIVPGGKLEERIYFAADLTSLVLENYQPFPDGRGKSSMERLKPPRYLALDVGSKRIGVAVSDELGITAQPVLTMERRRSPREDLRSIARLARRFEVAGIVVGNPLKLTGEVSTQALKTQAFAAELGTLTGLPIHLWDERLTTHEAHQMLYEAGHARQTHRRVVDQVAATLILRSFLEGRAHAKDQESGPAE
jgi:putative holliday junction resolvase